MNLFKRIEDDGTAVLQALDMDLGDLRSSVRTRTISAKKAMIYSHLRQIGGYSWHEIGEYCHKDHSTIIKVVKKNTKLYALHSKTITKKTQDI